MRAPDYRDRVGVFLWVMLAMLAVELLLELPARRLTWMIFGTPLSVDVSSATLLAIPLLVLAASGVEAIVGAHPRAAAGDLPHRWVLWSLPCAAALVAAQLLPAIEARLTWLAGLVAAGLLLALIATMIYHSLDEDDRLYRRARVTLNLIVYAVVFLLFYSLFQARVRTVFSGTLTAFVSTLLAIELLRNSAQSLRQALTFGLLCGLLLGQAAWALNYTQLPGLHLASTMLLFFYVLVGLAQQGVAGVWRRAVVLEFTGIGLAGVAAIWLLASR